MNSKKFDEWREAARRKAQELDDQYNLRSKLKDGVKEGIDTAASAARKASEVISDAAGIARDQATRIDDEFKVSENLRNAAERAGETIREGATDFSKSAEDTAREVFGQASSYYKRAEQAYNAGASGARIAASVTTGYGKARSWVKEIPAKRQQ